MIEHVNLIFSSKALKIDYYSFFSLFTHFSSLTGGELLARIMSYDYEPTECQVICYMKQIVAAVRHMHSRNVIHLDLKPENIMCVDPWSSHIKLIDFGLAREVKPNEDIFMMHGTAEFSAPEVLDYEAVSYPADVWSMGVICYILLTGLSPFIGEDDEETKQNIIDFNIEYDPEIFDDVSEDGLEFLQSLIVYEEEERLSAKEAARHAWLADSAQDKFLKLKTRQRQRKQNARRRWKKAFHLINAAKYMIKTGSQSSLNKSNNSRRGSNVSTVVVNGSCKV